MNMPVIIANGSHGIYTWDTLMKKCALYRANRAIIYKGHFDVNPNTNKDWYNDVVALKNLGLHVKDLDGTLYPVIQGPSGSIFVYPPWCK